MGEYMSNFPAEKTSDPRSGWNTKKRFCLVVCRATLGLQELTCLEELDLSETGMDDLGLQNLRSVKALNTLNVSYTGECYCAPDQIHHFSLLL